MATTQYPTGRESTHTHQLHTVPQFTQTGPGRYEPDIRGVFPFSLDTPFRNALGMITVELPRRLGRDIPYGSTIYLSRGDHEGYLASAFPLERAVDPIHGRGQFFRVRLSQGLEPLCAELDLGEGRLVTPTPRYVEVPQAMRVGDYLGSRGEGAVLRVLEIAMPHQEESLRLRAEARPAQ